MRFAPLVALVVFGSAVAFAASDNLPLIGSRTVQPTGELLRPLERPGGPAVPLHDELGKLASSDDVGDDRKPDRTRKRSRRDATMVAATVLAAQLANGRAETGVGQIERIVPDVRERVAELPMIRECTSSVGGDALCFDFGNGHYLLGDSPEDGQAELGFCASSGYYYVSGPELDGGARTACPGDRGTAESRDPPKARACASSTGGDATCFRFGGGRYIVSDPFDDGEGELGFCTPSGYYFVSAPSGTGGAGAECPDAAAG